MKKERTPAIVRAVSREERSKCAPSERRRLMEKPVSGDGVYHLACRHRDGGWREREGDLESFRTAARCRWG